MNIMNETRMRLRPGLGAAMQLLKMGGRCAVLTFSPPERHGMAPLKSAELGREACGARLLPQS